MVLETGVVVELYCELASRAEAIHNCRKSNNLDWERRHLEKIKELVEMLPHGSGFDSTPGLDVDHSGENALFFEGSFHRMDDNGMYAGWYDFVVIARPCFIGGVSLRVRGAFGRHQDLRNYILESYHDALHQKVRRD